jgi:hypothetical protein
MDAIRVLEIKVQLAYLAAKYSKTTEELEANFNKLYNLILAEMLGPQS